MAQISEVMTDTYSAEWACNRCGAVMTLSPGEEPCCGGGVHKIDQGDAFRCLCDEGDPDTSGPAEDCPEHGDVRLYAKWLDQACLAYDEREVEFKQLLADSMALRDHASRYIEEMRAELTDKDAIIANLQAWIKAHR